MNVFFCDINGTYDGNNDKRLESLSTLVNNLNNLIEVDNLDHLFFSFITTEHMDDVQKCVKELQPFLDGLSLKIGAQFSSEHILINGKKEKYESCKVSQMMKYLKDHKVERIYYADDSLMNHKVFEHTMIKAHPEISIQSFIPGTFKNTDIAIGNDEKGINGLNKILYKYVDKKRQLDEHKSSARI